MTGSDEVLPPWFPEAVWNAIYPWLQCIVQMQTNSVDAWRIGKDACSHPQPWIYEGNYFFCCKRFTWVWKPLNLVQDTDRLYLLLFLFKTKNSVSVYACGINSRFHTRTVLKTQTSEQKFSGICTPRHKTSGFCGLNK